MTFVNQKAPFFLNFRGFGIKVRTLLAINYTNSLPLITIYVLVLLKLKSVNNNNMTLLYYKYKVRYKTQIEHMPGFLPPTYMCVCVYCANCRFCRFYDDVVVTCPFMVQLLFYRISEGCPGLVRFVQYQVIDLHSLNISK